MRLARLALAGAVTVAAALVAIVSPAASAAGIKAASHVVAGRTITGCRGRFPNPALDLYYENSCTGHDEPELDPVSSAPRSGDDFTWTFVLPTSHTYPVSDEGSLWVGAPVNDPNSLYGEAYLEVQFDPDVTLQKCLSDGDYVVTPTLDSWGVCAPVWRIVGDEENAAFDGTLRATGSATPMVLHGGDKVTVAFSTTGARDGWHIAITDVTSGQSGTIVLDSASDGPLMPSYSVDKVGQSLKWGNVKDAPDALVWEIGHAGVFDRNPGAFCSPGGTRCGSYDTAHWQGISPIRILGVTFGGGAKPSEWVAASDVGGITHVTRKPHCHVYGGPFCIYPWYSRAGNAINFGADYPGTTENYGEAAEYATQPHCPSPAGPDTAYCATVLKNRG